MYNAILEFVETKQKNLFFILEGHIHIASKII